MIEISFNMDAVLIPIIITLLAIIYPIITTKDTGMFSGMDIIFKLIITLPIALISWIIYAICK